MIYMFGRQGFVTNQLLGLSTSVFFGPPLGVGMAQVLAFTPVAYLVLQGSSSPWTGCWKKPRNVRGFPLGDVQDHHVAVVAPGDRQRLLTHRH